MMLQTQEAKNLTKDSAKLKEEVESRDVRIKWLQNKMKQEADGYKVISTGMRGVLVISGHRSSSHIGVIS